LRAGGQRQGFTFERTEAIGRDVARAVFEALERGEWSQVTGIEIKRAGLRVPMDTAFQYLSRLGVLDTHFLQGASERPEIETQVYLITIGDAQVITTPGELFPEVFYGAEKHRRRDCPAADTRRPGEPSVRDRMNRKYRFILGLCPDELG
jgi:hypothetical protein